MKYIDNSCEIIIDDWDFFYVFVEEIYIGIQNIYYLDANNNLFDKLGKYQEYCLFDNDEFDINEKYKSEIYCYEKLILTSTPTHNIFLYEFLGKIWIEVNVGYENNPNIDENSISPEEFYSDFTNYRVLLTEISQDTITQWQRILKPYYDTVKIE